TGKVLQSFAPPSQQDHSPAGSEVAWHPSGRLLAAAADKRVFLWNVDTGKPHAILTGHHNAVTDCSFNHAGDVLASTGWAGTTWLWDPIAGKELVSIPGHFLQFSADDRFLAYAVWQTEVGIWEVARGRECRTLCASDQEPHGPWAVVFHPKGRQLASSHDDGV